ncbi:MAG: hypothetical protein EBZ74_01230, partial [Planctomycetia bacterium]|nr:hypothetical protein [Planctomycetia bacterium]
MSNTITLGASNGGLAKLLLSPVSGTTATDATLTASVLINSGGQLSLGAFNPSGTSTVGRGNLTGNVTIAGGSLVIEPINKQGTATGGNASITGAVTMTSGTLAYNTGGADRRLALSGDVSITGGAVTGTPGVFEFNNNTNIVFAPQSFDTRIGLSLYGTQTFSGSTAIGTLIIRGSGTKTVSTTASVASLQLMDGSLTGTAAAPLKLASNITTGSAPIAANYGQTIDPNGGLDFAIDADRYTLDFSSANVVWAPTKQPTGNAANTNTTWTLTGTAGTFKATGFNFSTSGTSVLTTNVGPGLVLLATGGTGANVLSGSGTIDPTSIFRFSGTTTVSGTPATLASTRTIGDLEVTSGALRITSLAGAQALRVTGGALDLNNSGYTFTSARLAGGSIQSGTLTTAGLFDLQSGTAAAVLAGSGSVSKTTTGTVTLSGNNTYGATSIDGGVLQIGSSGTTGSLGTGAVTNNANLTFSRSDNYGGPVSNAIAGTGSLTLASGTLTLSGSNGYTGPTSLNGGVLALGTSSALAGGGTISFGGGTLQFSSGNTQDYSGRIKSSGSAISIDTNSQAVPFTATLDSTNTGGLTKLGSGTLTLSGSS